ncbi:hypothetical protein TNCV_420231 [Trichonephila clavipes]|uniref:Uncharacterized protein n=1 Tax=Trichonephila clavipes TaxID=2585209 RepID=A0A8X6S0U6_TRICX|nr:hypothetical protein TNCV_420231 [Trichonephila clavipes]
MEAERYNSETCQSGDHGRKLVIGGVAAESNPGPLETLYVEGLIPIILVEAQISRFGEDGKLDERSAD